MKKIKALIAVLYVGHQLTEPAWDIEIADPF